MTYGSPSAVKAWVALAGVDTANQQINACIGSTSARACDSAGIHQGVVFPDAPGIDGWVDCVVAACKAKGVAPAPAQPLAAHHSFPRPTLGAGHQPQCSPSRRTCVSMRGCGASVPRPFDKLLAFPDSLFLNALHIVLAQVGGNTNAPAWAPAVP